MDKLIMATLESRHFTFDGIGSDETEAVNVLIQGLRAHATQYGITADWWYESDMRAAQDAGKRQSEIEEPKRLIDDGLISIRTLERGEAYRDADALPYPPVSRGSTFDHNGNLRD